MDFCPVKLNCRRSIILQLVATPLADIVRIARLPKQLKICVLRISTRFETSLWPLVSVNVSVKSKSSPTQVALLTGKT